MDAAAETVRLLTEKAVQGRGERQLAEDKRGMVDPERAGAVPPAIEAEGHAAVFDYP